MGTVTRRTGAARQTAQGAPAAGSAHSVRAGEAARSAAGLPTGMPPALRVLSPLLLGAALAAAAALATAWLARDSRPLQTLLLAACGGQLLGAAWAHRRTAAGRALPTADEHGEQLAELNSAIVSAFAMAVDAKDQYSQGHTERVCGAALLIAERMGLSGAHVEALRMASMLHDIGKLGVPDHILSKPGKLSQEEMRKVQTHAAIGAALLESVQFPWPVVPIIRSHHEWYDGTGYPDALAGDQIPLGARILAVADVHDALLSPRPYRAALTPEDALRFIKGRAGTQFDPWVLEAFLAVLDRCPLPSAPVFAYRADTEAASPAPGADERSAAFLDIQQAHQEVFALYEIVQTMSRSLNVQETMDLVIAKMKRITDFAACAIFLRQDDGASIVAAAAAGVNADVIRGRRLPVGVGVSGAVVETGKPSGLRDSAREDLGPLLGTEAQGSTLAYVFSAPLVVASTVIGALSLYRTSARPFTEEDARLVTAVANQTGIAIENARQYEKERQSALSDQLTGLANARYFFLHLDQELNRGQRERTPVSLVAVDMNGLKHINDTFGHQQGDRVLRAMGDIFRRHVREYDTVVRYAGDEFFIILPGLSKEKAAETVSRIKTAIRGTSMEMLPGRQIALSASFGIATYPEDARYADALIAAADQAMYAEKRLSQQGAGTDGARASAGHQQ
jgi:diguanylate cyclase (GGDEF)-like protein/putative nucleotidyltransferase with HDIG domain